MSDKMMKMMLNKKKQGKNLSDQEKKSKLEALMGMKDLAMSHMGNKLKNLKKVTVASNSPEGLKAGLHKAEDLADQSDDDHAALEDSDMLGQMNKYSQGGSVEESGHRKGPVAEMPPEFETDQRAAREEAHAMETDGHVRPDHMGDSDEEPGYDAGTSDAGNPDEAMDENGEGQEQDSLDELVQESPDDPDQLEELIKKLQEKCDSLKQ